MPKTPRKNRMEEVNTFITQKKVIADNENVSVTLELNFKKSSIPVENADEEKWRDEVWEYILRLKSKDEDIALNEKNENFHYALKELYDVEWEKVAGGVLSYVCMLGMQTMDNEKELKRLLELKKAKKKGVAVEVE
jgi:hypothetical protein